MIWEVAIEANNPMEAAQEARIIQLTPGMSATAFDVWEHADWKMHRIDSVVGAGRLDRDEFFAVRAGLRLLQCRPNVPLSIQDIATAMLILDNEHMIFDQTHRGPSRDLNLVRK
jgi:hypothetical protein